MEVLVRLAGAEDHAYPNFLDVMQYLADSDLLEIIVGKLNPSSPPEVQANAAETLGAITRNAPSALPTKLWMQYFVSRIFGHAIEDSYSKSGLVHTLTVCISLLDLRRYAASSHFFNSFRGHHMFESPSPVTQETIGAMLPKLVKQFRHFFKSVMKPTVVATGEKTPRVGYVGHITRLCNKLVHLSESDALIKASLQVSITTKQSSVEKNSEWKEWQSSVLQEHNTVENVYRWAWGRLTTLQDRTRDNDYDVAALGNNLKQAFNYRNDDNEELGAEITSCAAGYEHRLKRMWSLWEWKHKGQRKQWIKLYSTGHEFEDQALKEGIVGEAGPLEQNFVQENLNQAETLGVTEFIDANFWRVDQQFTVLK
ncbi:hypothetical protein N665_0647s0011 [Sinapis alba]|nr:hypothetical protein N665_0647s0011 [Sinapis alba]